MSSFINCSTIVSNTENYLLVSQRKCLNKDTLDCTRIVYALSIADEINFGVHIRSFYTLISLFSFD